MYQQQQNTLYPDGGRLKKNLEALHWFTAYINKDLKFVIGCLNIASILITPEILFT